VDWIDLAVDRNINKGNYIVVAAFCKTLGTSGNRNPLQKGQATFSFQNFKNVFTFHAASAAKF
jgi:hypothetical protein